MRIHPSAIEIAKEVRLGIDGRTADGGISLPWLAAMVTAAGDGDHCEIGSLFGASAITAALAKERNGYKGKIVCVDPYEPREVGVVETGNKPIDESLIGGNPEALFANAEKMGVRDRIELVQKSSDPWPDELRDREFVSAFIDGNHLDEMPWKDFENLAERTSMFIAFDNFEEGYPAVMDAAHKAMQTREWNIYYKNTIFVALRRALAGRENGTPLHVF